MCVCATYVVRFCVVRLSSVVLLFEVGRSPVRGARPGVCSAVLLFKLGFLLECLIPSGTVTVFVGGHCALVIHTKWYSDCNGLEGVVP